MLEDKERVNHDHTYHHELPTGSMMSGHEYSNSARPTLSSSCSSNVAAADPAGFLDKDFSSAEVTDIIKSLGNGKAAGHDGIPNEALKNAPVELVELLVVLNQGTRERRPTHGRKDD